MSEALWSVFRQALAVTWKGMLALFAFMAIFFVLLLLIDRIFPGRDDSAENPKS